MSEEMEKFKPIDPVHLYVRTDEKYEEVRGEVHDMRIAVEHLKNGQEKLEGRVNQGVAITGQRNTEELSRQAVKIGQLEQTTVLHADKLETLEKLIISNHIDIKKMLDPIYKGILAIFFSILCGGAILWFVKRFGQ